MSLDRVALAKIDRRVLSELDHGDGVQLVKVPLSEAVWSTWRRYCQAVGLTMGEGVAGLIAHELGTLTNRDDHCGPVIAPELQSQLVARSEALDVRERRLAAREQSLKSTERLLRTPNQTTRVVRPHESRSERSLPVRFGLQVQTLSRLLICYRE